MKTRGEKIQSFVEAWTRMSDRQKDYYLRMLRRMHADPVGFSARMEREGDIFRSLLAIEDYVALDRWFSRGQMKLVKAGGR